MKASSLFCYCLIEPQSAVREIIGNFRGMHVFMGFLLLVFVQISVNISYQMVSPTGLSVAGLILEVTGAALLGTIHIVLFCAILHALITSLGYQGSYLKLLTWDFFAQAPMALLCAIWIMGKSCQILLGNPVLAGLIYLFSMLILFFQSFYLLGLGIAENYGLENLSRVFFLMVSSIFIYAALYILLFTGLFVSFLGALLNVTG